MTHLDDRVAALIDGELAYTEREKALAHLERCERCRRDVETERSTKGRLQAMPSPEPAASLLVALTRNVPRASHHSTVRRRRVPISLPQAGLLVAAASTASAGVLALAYVVGAPSAEPEPPPVSPPIAEFSSEFVGVDRRAPFVGPLPVSEPVQPVGQR